MKRSILALFSSALLCSTLLVNAETVSQEETGAGVEFSQQKIVTTPRDPKDPSKPFPGRKGPLTAYEEDNEQNYANATADNPKLLSNNEETDFGLSHVPAKLSFGQISDSDGVSVYQSRGDAAFYEDEIYHLQMMDNRSTEGASWHVSVQLKDKITSASGTHKVEGAMLWMPKGEARNELNSYSTAVDTTNFETFDGYITDTTPLEIWRTKGTADTRGKATSSYSWAANAMELHIPDYTDFLNESYSFSLIWTAAISPEM